MSAPGRVLLLIGSPRGSRSGSESLGGYLLNRLAERGMQCDRAQIGAGLPSEQKLSEIVSAIDWADLVILAVPLYVDSQPAPVVRTMEVIARRHRGPDAVSARRFAVILNCGLPETANNDLALRIYRRFAAEAGLQWVGGLALAMGEALDQQPLDRVGWLARRVRKSLDLSAAALADGQKIPDEAVALMARPLMPKWLYTFFAHRSWRQQARAHGAKTPLDARPYDPQES